MGRKREWSPRPPQPKPRSGLFGRYLRTLRRIRQETGDRCEICGAHATHGHHIIPVSETGIESEMVVLRGNILLLCDWCHKMQHPGIRSWGWGDIRKSRGRALHRG